MTMTAEEFRESIAKLGLKQVDAAKLLGKNDRTIRRWLVDGIENDPTTVLLLKLMLAGDVTVDRVQELKLKAAAEVSRLREALKPFAQILVYSFEDEPELDSAEGTAALKPVTWQWRYWYSSGEPGIWLSERRDDADDLLESGVLIREEKRPLYAATAILTLQGEIDALTHDMDRLKTSETEHLNRAETAEAEVVRLREALTETLPMCEQYADFIRLSVSVSDIEMHPYLPEIEQVIERARAATGKPE